MRASSTHSSFNTERLYNPDLLIKPGLPLLAKGVVEGFINGLHASPFHGFSAEFSSHQLYNEGDSVKNVDWKLFARSDKMFVKRYNEETNLRCTILIDTSSSVIFPDFKDKLRFIVTAVASLLELLRRQKDVFGLTFFEDSITFQSKLGSTVSHQMMLMGLLENLFAVKPNVRRQTNLAKCLHHLADSLPARSVIILFSDFAGIQGKTNEIRAAFRHLKYNRHEPIVFSVKHYKEELFLKHENRPTEFIDVETGESVTLNPDEIREAYTAAVKDEMEQLRLAATSTKVDFNELDTGALLKDVLLAWLIKRNGLKS